MNEVTCPFSDDQRSYARTHALDGVVSAGQLLVEPHTHIASTPFSLRAPNCREESEADFTGSY